MPGKKIDSKGKLYGRLMVSAYDAVTGKRVYRVSKQNQITDEGRLVVLDLLAQTTGGSGTPTQENPAYNQIWSLSVGSSSVPADATQTALFEPVTEATIAMPDDIVRDVIAANFEILITAEIAPGVGTDEIFAEAGLFTRGSQADIGGSYPTWESIPYRRMFARQTYPSFTKGETMRVVYEWSLGLTVSA
jgi:hypothetical protein